MTTQEIINSYADLLILQYNGKAKAYATIQAVVRQVIMDQLPLLVQAAYDVDSSVGVQLDVVGKYAGVTRVNRTFSGQVALDDDDFRLLINIKIIQNSSGSSLSDIQDLIAMFFPGSLRVFDYQNMRMDYLFESTIGSVELAEVFVRQGLLPKPMGVQLSPLIYVANIENIFSFRTYELPAVDASGYNTYEVYNEDAPWLTYENAIIA